MQSVFFRKPHERRRRFSVRDSGRKPPPKKIRNLLACEIRQNRVKWNA